MDTVEPRGDTAMQDWLGRAREIVPMLREQGDEIERRRELPDEIIEAMVRRGIFKMLLPKSIGGHELSPLVYTAVLEELATGDGSCAWSLGQNSGCSMTAPYLSHEIAKDVFGGPRGILAWGPELPGAGRGVAAEGGYPGHRTLGLRDRQPARHLARRAFPGLRGGRQPTHGPERAAGYPHDARSRKGGDDHRQLAGARPARHRQRQLQVRGPFRPRDLHRRARQRGRAARAEPALPVHQRHDLRDEVFARVARASRAAPRRRSSRSRATRSPAGAKARCATTT